MPDRETAFLITTLHDELEKAALVDRAHAKLKSMGLCRPHEMERAMQVQITVNVDVLHGHPAQILACIERMLTGITVENDEKNLLATVLGVPQVEII